MVQPSPIETGKPRIGMHHHAFLDIAPTADDNRLVVAAQHRAEPDAYLLGDLDLADHSRVRRQPVEARGRRLGGVAGKGVEGHGQFSLGLSFYSPATPRKVPA